MRRAKRNRRLPGFSRTFKKGQVQWRSYEQALKKAYGAEKVKFQNDQNKLRQDLTEALAAQASTRGALRAAAVGQLQEETQEAASQDVEMDEGWMALMKDTSFVEDQGRNREFDGWLQEELQRIGSPSTAAAAKSRAAMKGESQSANGDAVITPRRLTRSGLPSPSKGVMESGARHAEKGPRALYPFGCHLGASMNASHLIPTKEIQYRGELPSRIDPSMASLSGEIGRFPDSGPAMALPSAKLRKTPRTGINELTKPKGPAAVRTSSWQPVLRRKRRSMQSERRSQRPLSSSTTTTITWSLGCSIPFRFKLRPTRWITGPKLDCCPTENAQHDLEAWSLEQLCDGDFDWKVLGFCTFHGCCKGSTVTVGSRRRGGSVSVMIHCHVPAEPHHQVRRRGGSVLIVVHCHVPTEPTPFIAGSTFHGNPVLVASTGTSCYIFEACQAFYSSDGRGREVPVIAGVHHCPSNMDSSLSEFWRSNPCRCTELGDDDEVRCLCVCECSL